MDITQPTLNLLKMKAKIKSTRNSKQLASFVNYCLKNPEQRFFQALRNWAQVAFILKAKGYDFERGTYTDIEDTFYEE